MKAEEDTEVIKDEDDAYTDTNALLSHESRAVELEFIKTYESLPILWDVNHKDYTNKPRRARANDVLLKLMKKWNKKATLFSVRQKINILRSCYRKDLRRHLSSRTIGPDGEETYEYIPKNWKFYALLKFLGGKENENIEHIINGTNSIVEINVDNTNFEDEEYSELSGYDERSSQISDVLQTFSEDKIHDTSINKDRKKKKRKKVVVGDYFVEDNMLDKEFDAIGSNVVCKLKRMNSEQRCHAELLINKVLIEGLKNKLTDDTDLTEVYK